MKKIIVSFFMFSLCFIGGAGEVLWNGGFSKNGTLIDNGYIMVENAPQDQFLVKDGELTAVCTNRPHRGSQYRLELGRLDAGALIFEANVNTGNVTPYTRPALTVEFCNILTTFHGNSWNRLLGGGEWAGLGKIAFGEYHTFKIAFNAREGWVEYYVDDMEHPVFSDQGVEFPDTFFLIIRNYGLEESIIENRMRNIRIESIPEKCMEKKPYAIAFRGICFEDWRLDEIAGCAGWSQLDCHTLGTAYSFAAKNNFTLESLPPISAAMPAAVIMADMPIGEVIPPRTQEQILEWVRSGSTLLVLGGMFTLNKGDFTGTLLGEAIGIDCNDPWAVTIFEPAQPLPGLDNARVKYMHRLIAGSEYRTVLQVGGEDFLIVKRYGEGWIAVVSGMCAGDFSDGTPGFWENEHWPEFLIDQLGGELNK